MTITARAAVLRSADGPFTIEDIRLDDPGPGEVLVRIAGVGVCHTDFLPRTPVVAPPIVAGHEGAGIIEALGEGVSDLAPGDHVVLSFDSCGNCPNCHDGHPGYCDVFWSRNLSGYRADRQTNVRDRADRPIQGRWFGQSSFADVAVVAARNVIKVDADLPLERLGPLSCSVLTGAGSIFNCLAVESGSNIAIFGAGTVGLSAVMAAKVAGASTIVAVDVQPQRLQLAEKYGATHTFLAPADDLVQRITSCVGGGLDATLDTTGVPEVISTAIDVLRQRGICGCVGAQHRPLHIRPDQLSRGRTITGILEGDAVPKLLIPTLIELWQQGRFPFDDLIEFFALDQINDAEAAMTSGTVVKPVLLPGKDRL